MRNKLLASSSSAACNKLSTKVCAAPIYSELLTRKFSLNSKFVYREHIGLLTKL